MSRLVNAVESVIRLFSKHVSAWMVFVMIFLVITEAAARYIFNKPLMLSDELGAYMLAVIAVLGIAYTWEEKGHIRVDVIVSRLRTGPRKWLRLITLSLAVILSGVLIEGSYELVAYSLKTNTRSQTWLAIPQAWPQMFLIIGFFFLFVVQLVQLVKVIKNFKAPGKEID